MHATHFLFCAFVSLVATPLGVHHHSEAIDVEHAKTKALHGRRHKRNKPKLLHPNHKDGGKDVAEERKTHFHDPTSSHRSKHELFHWGQRLIHNAKVELQKDTGSDDSWGASDSFVIADNEANLIVKGHSDYLRRMQRHAGPDICLAKARSLVWNKLDMTKVCRSLMCTAAYTLAYTLGLKKDLPTPGCQVIETHSEMPAKSEKSETAKSEQLAKSKKSDFAFFCNAKYPKLLPSVLLKSGFAPIPDQPGFWRTNTTEFPAKLKY